MHPLTKQIKDKLWSNFKYTIQSIDKEIDKVVEIEITSWLRKKAQKLRQSGGCGVIPFSRVYPILGLENKDDNWSKSVMQLDAEREAEFTNFVNTKKCDKCEVNGAVNCPDHGVKKSYSPLKDAECEQKFQPRHVYGGCPYKSGDCHCDLVPAPAVKESWCEHLTLNAEATRIYNKGENCVGRYSLKFCPVCGKPRPTTKTLAQKLREMPYQLNYAVKLPDIYFERLSKVALSYFKSIVESQEEIKGVPGFISKAALLAKMEEGQ